MFVYTLKATTLKYIGVMTLCAAAMITTVSLVPATDKGELVEASASVDYKNVKTKEDREDFLKSFGWDIVEDSEKVIEIRIPEEFDEIYQNYNALQKPEGLNLEKYKGKKVKLYTYTVTNHKDGKATATIIVYKNRVIAGDVSSVTANGSQTSFSNIENQV